MKKSALDARLKWSRKRMLQRKNKPLAKHGREVWATWSDHAGGTFQAGRYTAAKEKAE